MARRIHPKTNVAEFERSIIACYALATAAEIETGKHWYPKAISALETIRLDACGPVIVWDASHHTVAAICAVLSPRVSWQSNLDATRKIVRAVSQGNRVCPSVAGVRRNVTKAWEIANTGNVDIVSGPKVSAFFANLCGDFERVTIDVWAARACGLPDEVMNHLDRTRYVAIETAYRNAARALHLLPAELQAICWIVERGHGEGNVTGTNQARWIQDHTQAQLNF